MSSKPAAVICSTCGECTDDSFCVHKGLSSKETGELCSNDGGCSDGFSCECVGALAMEQPDDDFQAARLPYQLSLFEIQIHLHSYNDISYRLRLSLC